MEPTQIIHDGHDYRIYDFISHVPSFSHISHQAPWFSIAGLFGHSQVVQDHWEEDQRLGGSLSFTSNWSWLVLTRFQPLVLNGLFQAIRQANDIYPLVPAVLPNPGDFKYSRQDRRCYSMFSTNLSDCVPNFDPLVYPYGDCNGIGMGWLDMIWWYMMGLLCILSRSLQYSSMAILNFTSSWDFVIFRDYWISRSRCNIWCSVRAQGWHQKT